MIGSMALLAQMVGHASATGLGIRRLHLHHALAHGSRNSSGRTSIFLPSEPAGEEGNVAVSTENLSGVSRGVHAAVEQGAPTKGFESYLRSHFFFESAKLR
jgi:hypothetical protein